MNSFARLGLVEPLQRALADEQYTHPTPIQEQAIPHVLAGRDLLGCARTGTGKTAAFALPILQRLSESQHAAERRSARALVLVPTRELAAQVRDSFTVYGRRLGGTVAVVYGGVGQAPQVRALERGVDILVATPGRLLDLMQQKHVRLDKLEVLVLDEADQMLDLGFVPDVRRILAAVPKRRQTLLFSATMPPAIASLADSLLTKPAKVFVSTAGSTVDAVEQHVHYVTRTAKPALLSRVLRDPAIERVLVFTRTKRGADRVARKLTQDGIRAEAIHGNKSQNARERTLDGFRRGKTRVLVATDIAARGIDIDDITHVINYELPNVAETYVHRIGRTARAGATGVAISLCDGEERAYLRDIERLIKRKIAVVHDPKGRVADEHAADVETVADQRAAAQRAKGHHVRAPLSNGRAKRGAPSHGKPARDQREHAPQGAHRGGSSRNARHPANRSTDGRRGHKGPAAHHGAHHKAGPRRLDSGAHRSVAPHHGSGARREPAHAVRQREASHAATHKGGHHREREASAQPFGAQVR